MLWHMPVHVWHCWVMLGVLLMCACDTVCCRLCDAPQGPHSCNACLLHLSMKFWAQIAAAAAVLCDRVSWVVGDSCLQLFMTGN
jgi:hypothetical protein